VAAVGPLVGTAADCEFAEPEPHAAMVSISSTVAVRPINDWSFISFLSL
jgi:hypothetical protein